MGRFWEWNHGHQDGKIYIQLYSQFFHVGRAGLIVTPGTRGQSLLGPEQPGRSVGRPAHPGPSLFFPESERTGPAVGGRPHSTARALPGGRVRAAGGGCRRGAVT